MKFLIVFILFICLTTIDCYVQHTNECRRDITPNVDFQLSDLVGQWYRFSKLESEDSAKQKCTTLNITLNYHGNSLKYSESTIYLLDEPVRVNLDYTVAKRSPTSRILDVSVLDPDTVDFSYYIISADFNNYMILYYCDKSDDLKITIEDLIVLSRKPTLSIDHQLIAANAFSTYFPNNKIETTVHNSPYCSRESRVRNFEDLTEDELAQI